MVDPLDGTKEFIKRNGEFTVNIALIDAGKPVLGVIYIPATGQLYLALNAEQKAYTLKLDKHQLPDQDLLAHAIPLQPSLNSKEIRVVGSRSHMNETTLHYIESLKSKSDKPVVIVSKGSSLKFCLIAEGKAEVYPRFAPTMEWDTAAGHALCNAVGIQVIDTSTLQELKYNKAELLNSYFCVVNERSFI
jgi:3'(2'), 5'-bisphosphate nucleotidase